MRTFTPLTRQGESRAQFFLGLIDGKGFVGKATGKVVFSYAHPIFRAPFSLVGDGEGGTPAG